jgi:hypothetical protein
VGLGNSGSGGVGGGEYSNGGGADGGLGEMGAGRGVDRSVFVCSEVGFSDGEVLVADEFVGCRRSRCGYRSICNPKIARGNLVVVGGEGGFGDYSGGGEDAAVFDTWRGLSNVAAAVCDIFTSKLAGGVVGGDDGFVGGVKRRAGGKGLGEEADWVAVRRGSFDSPEGCRSCSG